jgi:putative heme-binding domain-containing protein
MRASPKPGVSGESRARWFAAQVAPHCREEKSEFLTSSDPWFHPIALSHGPDGSIYIVDFYREIIEDYSAIPRYLQQQYGLVNGKNHGRIWRLTHADAKAGPPADMSGLLPEELAREVASGYSWRRQTARRLLVEGSKQDVAAPIARLVREHEPSAALNALQTLDGLGKLAVADVGTALSHADAAVRRESLRLSERWINDEPQLRKQVLSLLADKEPLVRLQLALTLGECHDAEVIATLAALARNHGAELWMSPAILTSAANRGGALLSELFQSPLELAQAASLVEPLCAAIGNRRDAKEISAALAQIAALRDTPLQEACLRGLRASFKSRVVIDLDESGRVAAKKLAFHSTAAIRDQGQSLLTLLGLEDAAERRKRLAAAAEELSDIQLPVETRLAALAQLNADDHPEATRSLLAALASSTPQLREATLNAIFGRRDRLPLLLEALEQKTVPAAQLSAVQRSALMNAKEPEIRKRAASIFESISVINDEVFTRYAQALGVRRDLSQGEKAFRQHCAACHQAHGLGHAVGPDLSSEFQRAEETILRDVLAPNDTISAGYVTYALATKNGQVFSGLLAAESPTSLTLRQAEGKEQVILRKDLDELKALPVSMMPEDLFKTVSPGELANVLAWLRRPPTQLVLLDENRELVEALNEGSGTAEFVSGAHAGQLSLCVTPPQRFSARIKNWEFRIRERPASGEYRYLRFAWKAQGDGLMLELAADGAWPAAEQPQRRYYSGKNSTGWKAIAVADETPREWTVVTVDLWKDIGDFTLTGIAPTAMGGPAYFDRIELLQSLDISERR